MTANLIKPKKIIVIGASAGGLDPIQRILSSLPSEAAELTFIVAQHLSPNYKSMLTELLGRKTNIPVLTVKNQQRLEAGKIYVIAPNSHVEIKGGRFLFVQHENLFPKPNVSVLMKTVAQEYSANAVGIICSGTGQDGSEGCIEIEEQGGVCVAQDLSSCKYVGMPQSAIKTNKVRYILSPEDIGENLLKIVAHEKIEKNKSKDEVEIKTPAQLATLEIFGLLEQKMGVDFSNYKKSTINRRLKKRIAHGNFDGIENYLEKLISDPTELTDLFNDMLIGVTEFFRDKKVFDALKPVVLDIVKSKLNVEHSLRIWIAGCASGEEAYTIAILFREAFEEVMVHDFKMQIFATDIDYDALMFARQGKYPSNRLKGIPKPLLDKYFLETSSGYEVVPALKKDILFSKHDITANPPFLKLDLVSCRNLLIYFNLQLQRNVFPVFHYALRTNGTLLLGKSESIGTFKNLFATVDHSNRIFRKRNVDRRLYSLPHLRSSKKENVIPANNNLKKRNLTLSDMVKETLFNTFEHPFVVVDENLEMLEVNKDVSAFLNWKSGSVSTNLLKLVLSDLQLEVRTLMSKAIRENKVVKGKVRYAKLNHGDSEYVRILIKPLLYSAPNQPYFVVIFECLDMEEEMLPMVGKSNSGMHDDPRVLQLDHELEATKEHMSTLVEELETSNEELQSTNEELQSSNEELQASNEELETSNEELQATNEELEVAYAEIRKASTQIEVQKEDLAESQSRLQALFDSTVQGHVMIDSSYNILTYNDRALSLYKSKFKFNLTTSESFIDSIPSRYIEEFHSHFKRTLKGEIIQTVVELRNAEFIAFHFIPVSPKRTNEKSVLISCANVTAEKRAEKRLIQVIRDKEKQSELWQKLFEGAPMSIAVLSGEKMNFTYANRQYLDMIAKDKVVGRTARQVLKGERGKAMCEKMQEVARSGHPVKIEELELEPNKRHKNSILVDFTCVRLDHELEETNLIVFMHDVTKKVESQKVLREANEFFEKMMNAMPQKIYTTTKEGENDFNNHQLVKFTGRSSEQLQGDGWVEILHPDDLSPTGQGWESSLKTGKEFAINHRIKSKGGAYKWHLTRALPLLDDNKNIVKWVGASTDIDDQKRFEQKKDEFLNVASHELKTPLSTVIAYTEIVRDHEDIAKLPEIKQYLNKSLKSQERLNNLISELLDVTRIQNGKLKLNKDLVHFCQFINEVKTNFSYANTSHTIHLQCNIDERAEIDVYRLEQVLTNILSNAVKYSPDANEIIMKVEKKGTELITSIQDFGIGMAKRHQNKIFDRFYRVAEDRNTASGLGIGLYITAQIIEQHEGEIWLESKIGEGSTISFSLPIIKKN